MVKRIAALDFEELMKQMTKLSIAAGLISALAPTMIVQEAPDSALQKREQVVSALSCANCQTLQSASQKQYQ
jgi:hypothetical protein